MDYSSDFYKVVLSCTSLETPVSHIGQISSHIGHVGQIRLTDVFLESNQKDF